jgi:hypothetical protein
LKGLSKQTKLLTEKCLEYRAIDEINDDSWLECNFSGIDGIVGSISLKKGWTKRYVTLDELITYAAEAKEYGKTFESRGAQLLRSRVNDSPNQNAGWLDYEDFLEFSTVQKKRLTYGTRRSSRLKRNGSKVYDHTHANNDDPNKNQIYHSSVIEEIFRDEKSFGSFEFEDEDGKDHVSLSDDEDSLGNRDMVDLDDDDHFEDRCAAIAGTVKDKDHGYGIEITYDAVVSRVSVLEKVKQITQLELGALNGESTVVFPEMKLLLLNLVHRATSIRFASYVGDFRHDKEKVCILALMFVDSHGNAQFELLRQEKRQYAN